MPDLFKLFHIFFDQIMEKYFRNIVLYSHMCFKSPSYYFIVLFNKIELLKKHYKGHFKIHAVSNFGRTFFAAHGQQILVFEPVELSKPEDVNIS